MSYNINNNSLWYKPVNMAVPRLKRTKPEQTGQARNIQNAKRNIKARSRNHFCSGKAIILNIMCVGIFALDIRHAKRI